MKASQTALVILSAILLLVATAARPVAAENPPPQPGKSGEGELEDSEVQRILDEEIEEEPLEDEEEEKKPAEKGVQPPQEEIKKKPKRKEDKPATVRRREVGKMTEALISEEAEIDWDASFEKEFAGREGEVFTPSRRYEESFHAIPPVESVTSEEIFELNESGLNAAFQKFHSLHLVNLQDFAPSPVIGGLYGSRLPLLFDGIRMAAASAEAGLGPCVGFVDLYSLKSIEVLGAPSPVLYGPSAMGGVIHFVPVVPVINPFISSVTSLNGLVRFATVDTSMTTHLDATLLTPESGIYAAGTMEKHVSLMSGGSVGREETPAGVREHNKQPFTGFDKAALAIVAARSFFPSHEFRLSYFYTSISGGQRRILRGGGNTEMGDHLSWPRFEGQLLYLRYIGSELPIIGALEITGGFRLRQEGINRHLTMPEGVTLTDRHSLNSGGAFSLLHSRAALGGWGELAWGVEWYFDRIRSEAFVHDGVSHGSSTNKIPLRGILPDGSSVTSLDGYALLELYFLRPLLLSIGGRGSWSRVSAASVAEPFGFSSSDRRDFAGGGAQIQARIPIGAWFRSTRFAALGDVISFNVAASLSYRPPTLDELLGIRMVGEGLLYGRPDLDGEMMVTGSGGFKLSIGFLEGLLFYSYSHFESMIFRKPIGDNEKNYYYDSELCTKGGVPCWIYQNGGRAGIHGILLRLEAHIRDFLRLGTSTSYLHGVAYYADGSEPLSYMPPLGGAWWLRATYQRYRLWGEVRFDWAWKQDRLSARDRADPAICPNLLAGGDCGGTEAYLLLSVRGGVRLTSRFFLSFAFTNLTNSRYKTHGSILYGPGIGASVSAEARL